jgi:bifunctional UDP-N-acetylglucosamine pyrophosphorylase/glucosamine-1-phosphate N-acetyltransferase
MPSEYNLPTQAVIMAAGLGMRLRPLTATTPKPLLPVAGRPILEWTIERLPAHIEEVIIVVSYLKEKIIAHFGSFWGGKRITYVRQDDLKGTGHALCCTKPLLNEQFIVLNGDDIYAKEDIASVSTHSLAILAKEVSESGRFGAFRTDADGRLLDIVEAAETSSGSLVNAGLYSLNRSFFNYPLVPIKDGTEFGLPQTLVTMTKEHPIQIVRATQWIPIGYPADLERATDALRSAAVI